MSFALIGVFIAVEAMIQAGGEVLRVERLSAYGQIRQKIWAGEYWRLITCVFFHGNLVHMALNSFATFLFGRVVEGWLGHRRFLVCFLLFGLSGSLAFQAFSDFGTGIGASGAICGLIGVFLVGRAGRLAGGQILLGARFWKWITVAVCLLLLESLFVEAVSGEVRIADSAHFGGLTAGVLGAVFLFSAPVSLGYRRRVRAGLFASLYLFGLGTYGLAFPVFDWSWYVWRIERMSDALDEGYEIDHDLIAAHEERARYLGGEQASVHVIRLKVKRGDVDGARRYWLTRPTGSLRHDLTAGDTVYDGLYVAGYRDMDLDVVLDRLIELSDEGVSENPDDLLFLNSSAWYRALRDVDLDTARERAEHALEILPREASFLNTLGWVCFRNGDLEPGFKYLKQAVTVSAEPGRSWGVGLDLYGVPVRQSILGENLLYLALAYYENGQISQARDCAVSARRVAAPDGFEDRALTILEELEESLGTGGT